jgi:hypothetical protein
MICFLIPVHCLSCDISLLSTDLFAIESPCGWDEYVCFYFAWFYVCTISDEMTSNWLNF